MIIRIKLYMLFFLSFQIFSNVRIAPFYQHQSTNHGLYRAKVSEIQLQWQDDKQLQTTSTGNVV